MRRILAGKLKIAGLSSVLRNNLILARRKQMGKEGRGTVVSPQNRVLDGSNRFQTL
jgi:hypothetical protein